MKKITVETCVTIYQTRMYDIEVADGFPDIISDDQKQKLLERICDEQIEEYGVDDDIRDEIYRAHKEEVSSVSQRKTKYSPNGC